ncbi:MAG: efflux RND transporter permease subunit [Acidobacteria bacterium]|nr:efflux RND transporter permease subunit [Acidobacteriota bacterium]
MKEKENAHSFIVTRPVAILMVFLAAFVFGLLSYFQLPLALLPELSYPTLTVRTEYPGAAPEEVENDISRPVEEALGVVNGLVKLSSISRAGVSDVVLEFGWDSKISDATQDVLERLDLVQLPEEARRPLILHYDPSLDPILELSLSSGTIGDDPSRELKRLRRLAELQVKRALEPVKGVAAVRVRGGLEEEIHVSLDEQQLRRTGLSIRDVIDRLAEENINVAGGTLKEGRTEYMVRTLNEFEDLDQVRNTVLTIIDGREIRVKDIGTVENGFRDREIVTRTDGGESIQIEIFKEADVNIVALAKRVRAVVGEAPADAEATAQKDDAGTGLAGRLLKEEDAILQVVADRSLFIESSLREVRRTALLGGLLAILVIYLVLRRFSSTLIIGLSIPISLIIAFAPLNLMGVSLNIMSLGGLAMGIGMLVDSSIVVLESIHRCREEGDDLPTAADRGTREVRTAVLASTLTSIAVFFPMVFVQGVAGQAFGDLGTAVVVSLLAAAAVALFFIPMLASRGAGRAANVKPAPMRVWRHWAALNALTHSWSGAGRWLRLAASPYWAVRFLIGAVLELTGKLILTMAMVLGAGIALLVGPVLGTMVRLLLWLPGKLTDMAMQGLARVYPLVLRRSMAHPAFVLVLVGLTGLGTWQVLKGMDSELLPQVHQGEFTVEVALPVGTPLEYTDAILEPVEQAILAERENIRSLLLTVGYDSSQSQRSDEGEHTARFKVLLQPSRDPAATEAAVLARLRKRFAGIPDLETHVTRPVLFSSKTPIQVEVHGNDLMALRTMSEQVRQVMAGLPALTDVEATLRRGAPEVQILYDRDRLAHYGLNIGQVARRVREKVQGFEATRFNMKDRRIPILVRLTLEDRETVDDVRRLQVNPGQTPPIPLAAVAQVTLGEGPSEVRRVDGRRIGLVQANLAAGSLSSAITDIRAALDQRIEWPATQTYFISGQNEEWERSRASLWLAMALSIFLVYVIMAAQFESLTQPLLIMLTIPLAFIGTVVTLKALGINLSVVVFLGMIMLAGIVVNNAIVLVDYINTLRRRGMEIKEAVLTAGRVRLRPILMTTATTILGLLPMALGWGDGAELRAPMALAVISGLLSSTILTLVVIPTLYTGMDSLLARLRGGAPVPGGTDDPLPTMAGEVTGTVTP